MEQWPTPSGEAKERRRCAAMEAVEGLVLGGRSGRVIRRVPGVRDGPEAGSGDGKGAGGGFYSMPDDEMVGAAIPGGDWR